MPEETKQSDAQPVARGPDLLPNPDPATDPELPKPGEPAPAMNRGPIPRGTVSEERAFVENWWKCKFSMPNLATGDDVIMVSHALELLEAFRGACDAKWVKGAIGKSFLEAWWLRKFPANPLKWGSVLSLADAEELLMEFRISTEATPSPDEKHYEMVSSPEEKTSRGSYTSEGREAGAHKAAQARWVKKKEKQL
jgi:hypothetical protein